MIENLNEAKKVEEHAAKFEVAPVVAEPNVEVSATCIISGRQCLKSLVVLPRMSRSWIRWKYQRYDSRELATCLFWLTRHQKSTPIISETPTFDDVEPKTEESSVAKGEVETVIVEPEEVTSPVQGMAGIQVPSWCTD